MTRLKIGVAKVIVNLRLLQSVRNDTQDEDGEQQMHDRGDVRGPFAHGHRNIRAEAVFVINVPDTAGDQRESGPDPKIVLFLIDHEIDGSHLPRLDPDVPKTAGHDR